MQRLVLEKHYSFKTELTLINLHMVNCHVNAILLMPYLTISFISDFDHFYVCEMMFILTLVIVNFAFLFSLLRGCCTL